MVCASIAIVGRGGEQERAIHWKIAGGIQIVDAVELSWTAYCAYIYLFSPQSFMWWHQLVALAWQPLWCIMYAALTTSRRCGAKRMEYAKRHFLSNMNENEWNGIQNEWNERDPRVRPTMAVAIRHCIHLSWSCAHPKRSLRWNRLHKYLIENIYGFLFSTDNYRKKLTDAVPTRAIDQLMAVGLRGQDLAKTNWKVVKVVLRYEFAVRRRIFKQIANVVTNSAARGGEFSQHHASIRREGYCSDGLLPSLNLQTLPETVLANALELNVDAWARIAKHPWAMTPSWLEGASPHARRRH